MTEVQLYNNKFEAIGKISATIDLSVESINEPVVHQVVKSLLANRRQGNACNKNKALVRGGGAKPFKQKGTGRARQGSSRSPLQVGGGSAFGPLPRSYAQKINKKMMVRAIQSVVADKLQAGKLFVIEKLDGMSKSKEVFAFLSGRKLDDSLLIVGDQNSPLLMSARNLERAGAYPVAGFSVYEAVKHENLVIEKQAFDLLLERVNKTLSR
ncbi:MAG: 50S ribosomal protein L4 [Oligoflexia bacterium]|nr:50S ribosomal protein L4 [Oligoflexia bacterium]